MTLVNLCVISHSFYTFFLNYFLWDTLDASIMRTIMVNNTAILNCPVQQSGIPIPEDIYEDNVNDESVESSYPNVFLEIQKDTMQVPFLASSIIDMLTKGTVKAFDAAIYLCYNAFSNWDWGISHSMSIRNVAKIFSVSCQYVQQAIKRLCGSKWFERLSGKHKISKFKLKHHLCEKRDIPLDKDGRPAKCAMPRGEGGLFERLELGDICWKSLLIWMLLKINSDFTTGLTEPITIEQLREWTGFGTTTICDCLNELVAAGMLEKLSRRPQEAQSYQLYPKPYVERRKRKPMSELTWRDMRAVGDWRYSFNEQWRVNVETLDVQYRPNSKTPFRNTSDREKYYEMPKSIREDFDVAIIFHAKLVEALNQDPYLE